MIRLKQVLVQKDSFSKEYSLSFGKGQWTTITGPSGAGKTSLLEVMAGIIRPVSGLLEIGGKDMRGVAPGRRNLAMVCQDNSLFSHLSLKKNLLLAQHDIPEGEKEKLRRMESLLEPFSLNSEQLTRFPADVSGGELARFNICAALLRKKALLLLDEPLAALNQSLQETVIGALREIQTREKLTVLCVSHQTTAPAKVTDQYCCLTGG